MQLFDAMVGENPRLAYLKEPLRAIGLAIELATSTPMLNMIGGQLQEAAQFASRILAVLREEVRIVKPIDY